MLHMTGSYSLPHLRQLEAESIHIIREVAAEFENPVMLYSIGKDSSVMVRLAQKAFHPGRLPFPLLHVDTTWKFREMIAFRDQFCREQGLELIVYINEEAVHEGINPFDHGSNKYTGIMKTQALQDALNRYGFDAAFGGARRDEEKTRAKERVYSFRDRLHQWDPEEPAAGAVESLQRQGQQGRDDPGLPPLQLDRAGRLAVHPPGEDPHRAALLRRPAPGGEREGNLIMVDDERMRLRARRDARDARSSASGPWAAIPSPGPSRARPPPCPRSSRRCSWPRAASARAA